jgi:hypothetical protein
MATLAGNLAKIRTIETKCYPGLEVGWIGNAAHQAEASDHNPDSRGIVHAIDLMFGDDVKFHAGAPASLHWLLEPEVRNSLEYVIHDRRIYRRDNGWVGVVYTGKDPHTNHIHISGKHGTVGKNTATGTGYSVTAEQMTPVGSPCATEEDMATIDSISPAAAKAIGEACADALVSQFLGHSGPTVGVVLQNQYGDLNSLVDLMKVLVINTTPPPADGPTPAPTP